MIAAVWSWLPPVAAWAAVITAALVAIKRRGPKDPEPTFTLRDGDLGGEE